MYLHYKMRLCVGFCKKTSFLPIDTSFYELNLYTYMYLYSVVPLNIFFPSLKYDIMNPLLSEADIHLFNMHFVLIVLFWGFFNYPCMVASIPTYVWAMIIFKPKNGLLTLSWFFCTFL